MLKCVLATVLCLAGFVASLGEVAPLGGTTGQVPEKIPEDVVYESGGAAFSADPAVGSTLRVRISEGEDVAVSVVSEGPAPADGCMALYGTTEGYSDVLNVVLVRCPDGAWMAEIRDFAAGRRLMVETDASGSSRVRTLHARPRPYDAAHPDGRALPAAVQSAAVRRAVRRASAERAGPASVDVLVAYDRAAQDWVDGGQGGITNFAQFAVARMNVVLANSGLGDKFRFRLAGVATVAADGGADLDVVLENVTDGLGAWSAVRAAREDCRADVVTTLIDTGSPYGWSGLGWSLEGSSGISAFDAYAFNVCSVRSVAESDTMLHEIGHNMGAGHADAAHMDEGHGPQLHVYSAGHHFSAGAERYHTVMAYNVDRNGVFYRDVPFFSSPDKMLGGVPVGDADHDNVRTLVATYEAVAAFRAEPEVVEEVPVVKEERLRLYASPTGTAFAGSAAYDGWLRDEDGVFAGSLTLKAGRPGRDGLCKLTCTHVPFGGRRRNVGELSPKAVPAEGNPAIEMPGVGTLHLGGDSLAGMDVDVQVGRDLLKDKAAKAAAWRRLEAAAGIWTFALRTDAGDAGFSVQVGRKGKAKLAGVLPDGTRVSVSAQGVFGESAVAFPLPYSRKAAFACVFWVKDDGEALVTDTTGLRQADGKVRTVTVVQPVRVSANRVSGPRYFKAGAYVQPFSATEKKLDAGTRERNPSGLKLKLNAVTGLLTGSFRDESGRRGVAGAFVDGVFYGSVYGGTEGSGVASIEVR